MLPTFLAQLAGGSALAVAVVQLRQVSWKYLRLMAIVCMAMAVLAIGFLYRESAVAEIASEPDPHRMVIGLLAAGVVAAFAWIVVNALQGESVRASQRLWAAACAIVWLTAAVLLATMPDTLVVATEARTAAPIALGSPRGLAATASVLLGAGLLGTATAAMLLGHRYLTDTGMSIAPLRRLAGLYLIIVALRCVWVIGASYPAWQGGFVAQSNYTWFWLLMSIRFGVGVLGTAIFAWMVWDCVRRRATQSATAIFYLSMIFVFLGEMSGQYLLRTESLAM